MKLKSLLLGALASTLLVGAAHAQTTLYIAGSTAYRPAATAAIIAYLGGLNKTDGAGHTVLGVVSTSDSPPTTSDLFGAGTAIFTTGDGSVVVKTAWTGSSAGLVDLALANSDNFLPSSAATSPISIPGINAASGTTAATGASTSVSASDAEAPNLTFSDSYNTSVAASLTSATGSGVSISALRTTITQLAHAGTSGNAGSQDAVGIIPFAWYAGNSFSGTTNQVPSDLTNVPQAAVGSLITNGNGIVPLSFFTAPGSSTADANIYIGMIGRNEDSGSRIGAFAEAQQGFAPNPLQFELNMTNTISTNTGKVYIQNTTTPNSVNTGGSNSTQVAMASSGAYFEQDAALYTEPKIFWNLGGHSGYAAGGDVANVLLANNSNPVNMATSLNNDANQPLNLSLPTGASVFFIGYLGWADGYKLTNPSSYPSGTLNTSKILSYNGVSPTVENIINGSYSFWAYEHMYYKSGSTSNGIGSNKGAADGIADKVFNTYACTNASGAVGSGATLTGQDLTPPVAGILYNSVAVTRGKEGTALVPPAP